MKKKALCAFIFIFWWMGALTFLSIKTQEQMIPQVTTIDAQSNASHSQGELPADCLFGTPDGSSTLFTVYEGSGWEAGTRAQRYNGTFFFTPSDSAGKDSITVDNPWHDFIQYASKPLQPGELVDVIPGGERAQDHWLALLPEEAPELEEAEGFVLEEQSGTAVQFSVEQAVQPFMEGRAKSQIPALKDAKIYSFKDMVQFLDALPLLGLVAAVMTAAFLLWVFSCFLSRDAKKNRAFLAINFVIGLVLLASLPLILHSIQLPSSLLPQEYIVDFGYYIQEYQEFFKGLQSFAPPTTASGYLAPNLPQSEAGKAIIAYKNNLIMRPMLIILGGAAFAGVVIVAEKFLITRRSIPRLPKGKNA